MNNVLTETAAVGRSLCNAAQSLSPTCSSNAVTCRTHLKTNTPSVMTLLMKHRNELGVAATCRDSRTDLMLFFPSRRHKADGYADFITIFLNHSRNHLKERREHNTSCDIPVQVFLMTSHTGSELKRPAHR